MSDPPPSSILHPRRILVRGVNWLGDAVMTTPGLQRLSERFPHARITLLTHEKLADLWRHHPSIDDIVTFGSGESPWSVARRLRAWHFVNGFFELQHPPPRNVPRTFVGGMAKGLNEATTGMLAVYARLGLWSPLLFDLALILPNSARSALELWLARIPQRIGYARPWRNWFLTQALPRRPGALPMRKRSAREIRCLVGAPPARQAPPARHTHQIHEYLHLVAALGASPEPVAPRLVVRPAEVDAAAAKFGLVTETTNPRPIFGLSPGAEYGPAKRWPVDRFIDAAREIQKRTNCLWLLLGGQSDAPLCEKIELAIHPPHSTLDTRHSTLRAPHAPLRNLAGNTSLRELMALLKLCHVLLTNDTGSMHVAAALGTRVVVPFGSTSPELTGPGMPGLSRHHLLKADTPCSPCFRRICPVDFRCMTGISVEGVVDAVLQAAAAP